MYVAIIIITTIIPYLFIHSYINTNRITVPNVPFIVLTIYNFLELIYSYNYTLTTQTVYNNSYVHITRALH